MHGFWGCRGNSWLAEGLSVIFRTPHRFHGTLGFDCHHGISRTADGLWWSDWVTGEGRSIQDPSNRRRIEIKSSLLLDSYRRDYADRHQVGIV